MFDKPYRHLTMAIVSVILAFYSTVINAAQDKEGSGEELELHQQIERIQQDYQAQIDVLKKRLDEPAQPSSSTADSAKNSSPMQIGLSGLFALGGSSVENTALESLQAGGHDPNQNGFTVQNIELSIGGTVDPYLDGQLNLIILINAEGETVVELEEAFFTSRNLPWGLQVKAGQYFTEFGRQNKQHPHTWAFADQPVILSRLFGGDGLRSQGVRVAWLMPTDWYSEITLGMQNAKGETVTSFLNAPGEEIGGHILIDRRARGTGDQLYSARWLNGIDISDTLSMNLGVSGLRGPNASGTTTHTQIVGADLYLKWQPAYTQRGYPFVSWHTEVLRRRYEAGDPGDLTQEIMRDRGLFTQALWGFKPGWVAGLRWEYARADGDTGADPLRDNRKRLSPNVTWYPSEFSKVRLQYNRDWTEHLPEKNTDSLWLQVEFSLGSHMAHTF